MTSTRVPTPAAATAAANSVRRVDQQPAHPCAVPPGRARQAGQRRTCPSAPAPRPAAAAARPPRRRGAGRGGRARASAPTPTPAAARRPGRAKPGHPGEQVGVARGVDPDAAGLDQVPHRRGLRAAGGARAPTVPAVRRRHPGDPQVAVLERPRRGPARRRCATPRRAQPAAGPARHHHPRAVPAAGAATAGAGGRRAGATAAPGRCRPSRRGAGCGADPRSGPTRRVSTGSVSTHRARPAPAGPWSGRGSASRGRACAQYHWSRTRTVGASLRRTPTLPTRPVDAGCVRARSPSAEADRLPGGLQHGHPQVAVRVDLVAPAHRHVPSGCARTGAGSGPTTISVRPDIAACTAAWDSRTQYTES